MSNVEANAGSSAWRWLRHSPYVLLIFATRFVAAAIVAEGFASIARTAVGQWPQGDSVLFEPGGLMLVEVIRQRSEQLEAAATQAGLMAVAMAPISIVTLTLLLVSLNEHAWLRAPDVGSQAIRQLRAMAIVYVVMNTLAVGIVMLFYAAANALETELHAWFGIPGGDVGYAAIVALGAIAAVLSGVVHDVIRVAVVRQKAGALEAIAAGWSCCAHRPWEIVAAYASRGAASVLLVLVSVGAAKSVGITAVVHQAVVLGLVALRAWWLARARDVLIADGVREMAGPVAMG